MAKCHELECQLEMLEADGCLITYLIFYGGHVKPRIPYGMETRFDSTYVDEIQGQRCHDCGCKPGKLHHLGCDMEECPVCHGQLLSCDDRIFEVIGQIPDKPEEDEL